MPPTDASSPLTGYYGELATTEGYFYGLDALPLWLAMTLYVFFNPARFIEGAREQQQAANTQYALEAGGATVDRYATGGSDKAWQQHGLKTQG